jgi:putative tryptophan/tyrosine transport system substrate-binding protein
MASRVLAVVLCLVHTSICARRFQDSARPRLARNAGVALPAVEAEELDIAFASAAAQHAEAMMVFGDLLFNLQAQRVVALAAEHHLPASYLFRQFAKGGLVVCGPDLADMFRRAGDYVDRILKGTKPSDLPVQQPTKFELVINLKTAKALGLTVPPSLLIRADRIGRYGAMHESNWHK